MTEAQENAYGSKTSGVSWSRLVPLALAVIIIFNLALQYYLRNSVLDDPFISFRYADNLAAGNGLVFNPGERVEGFSNPLWTIGFSLFSLMGLNSHYFGLLIVAKIIGALCAALSIIFVYMLSLALDPGKKISKGLHLLSPLLLGICPFYALWAQGGLESSFLSLLLVLACYHMISASNIGLNLTNTDNSQGKQARHIFISGLFFGLAGLTRPEIPLLFIVGFTIYFFTVCKRNMKAPGFLQGVGAFIFLVGTYEVFRIIYYGDIFPNSYYAKTGGGWPQYLYGLVYFNEGLRGLLGLLPLSILVFGPIFRRGESAFPAKLLFYIIFAYFIFIIYAGGDWMPKYRFFAHVFPLMAAVIGVQSCLILIRFRKMRFSLLLWQVFTLVFIAAVVASSLIATDELKKTYYGFTGRQAPGEDGRHFFINRAYRDMGLYMREHVPPDAYVALGEAGTVPYIGGFRVIDCYGLMDQTIARIKGKRHYKFDADYVMGREPDWILILGLIEDDGSYSSPFIYGTILFERSDFWENYEFEIHFERLILFKRKTSLHNR